ncbi:LPS export ABC transporter periplasmic protein LptC [Sphingoaurantiacus capsulatus]|uniref:LPS export ABC transporter periplasmic protein LptC n=1 Tax=Sphingoaurantiacus capsulatus TaxID=1771310 RepID=A0ABV7XFM5_9SPHN
MRANAAPPGGSWDRTVAILKLALPAGAAAVLAACLIWPLTSQQEFSFILSKDRVAEAQERLRMDRAVYRGEDSKGQPFTIRAASAVQKTSDTPIVELRAISAELRTADGPARADADVGRYDLERERIDVVGPVKLRSAAGYALDTSDVSLDLATRKVTGSGKVDGKMPLGAFTAGRLTADVNGRSVVLDKGASLRIVQR